MGMVLDWSTCNASECRGCSLPHFERCLEHLNLQELAEVLRVSRVTGRLDARGVNFSRALVERIYECMPSHGTRRTQKGRGGRIFLDSIAAPEDLKQWSPRFDAARLDSLITFHGTEFGPGTSFRGTTLRAVVFEEAVFHGDVNFSGALIERAMFGNAAFYGPAYFTGSRFSDGSSVSSVKFFGRCNFVYASFGDSTTFNDAQFSGDAEFAYAKFGDEFSLRKARFEKSASFTRATLGSDADFGGTQFGRHGRFISALFGDRASFANASFAGNAIFLDTRFGAHTHLGPLRIGEVLRLQGAHFERGGSIEVSCSEIDGRHAVFQDGIDLRASNCDMYFEKAEFEAPSIISARRPTDRYVDTHNDDQSEMPAKSKRPPRLLDLRGAQVTGLRLNGVDLRPCYFQSSHNLEDLRIEGPLPLTIAPAPWWTRRSVIVEEHWWRATYEHGIRLRGWLPSACQWPRQRGPVRKPSDKHTAVARASAEGISALYRALRKGLEDSKNEPGAADFYYGEMEMRRNARRFGAERILLSVYWLVAGYGQRASRALCALALLIVLAAVGFAFAGFGHAGPQYAVVPGHNGQAATIVVESAAGSKPGWSGAFLYSAESVTSLLTPQASQALTDFGSLLEIALRVLGPTLLGLSLFSLRGRVKR